MVHNIKTKQPQEIIILLLNTANTNIKLLKNIILGSITRVDNVECVENVSSDTTQSISDKQHGKTQTRATGETSASSVWDHSSFQTHAHDSSKLLIQLQDANDLPVIQHKLNTMLNNEFTCIISKSPTYFRRTNLVEMDLPTTRPPIAMKPYTILLKYKSFIDEEIKLLEDSGCISKSLSNWASPICIMKKKPIITIMVK